VYEDLYQLSKVRTSRELIRSWRLREQSCGHRAESSGGHQLDPRVSLLDPWIAPNYIYVYIHVCIHMLRQTLLFFFVYSCICRHIYIYIYTYTYTYTKLLI
jgi:hypothetical protein